jgi:cytochrome c
MTGVFHFMAISFACVFAPASLCRRRTPVNSKLSRPRGSVKVVALSLLIVLGVLGRPSSGVAEAESTQPRFAVLVFSKTTGFRHDSIPHGIAAIKTLGADHGFSVDSTEDAARFTDVELARFKVVIFLSTTGDILDDGQKAAFERYIRSGGGFAGIHSASDTEYQWAWYGRLVGAYFASHPEIQHATVRIEDLGHASTEGLPQIWDRTDEWYNFRNNPRGTVHVLATLDEATYSGGKMGADHPIAWCQVIDGGRSWYTAMGHTTESYAEPLYRLHLLGGIESAAGVAGGCPR